MKPNLLLYEELDGKYKLYLNEVSTLESLEGFDRARPINIIEFGATNYKGYGWATEKELPNLENVSELMDFLDKEGDIGLTTILVLINKSASLSTHDDGEAHLQFEEKHDCMAYIKQYVSGAYQNKVINEMINNPGIYVHIGENGALKKYNSFEQYLAQNP